MELSLSKMDRKIFEKKFPNQSEATKYLDEKNWRYVGKKGLFKKYYRYEAVNVWRSTDGIGGYPVGKDIVDDLMVKLYTDGLTKVFATGNPSLSGICSFPERVWSSYERYLAIKKTMHAIQGCLDDHIAKALGETDYILYKEEERESSIVHFKNPKELYDYSLNQGITVTKKCFEDLYTEI